MHILIHSSVFLFLFLSPSTVASLTALIKYSLIEGKINATADEEWWGYNQVRTPEKELALTEVRLFYFINASKTIFHLLFILWYFIMFKMLFNFFKEKK